MSSMVTTIASFLVALGVLITVHEFGHFWVARRLGVKVLRFSVGFGRPLGTWRGKVDDTEFVIGALPLGGYVKMLDEREGEVDEHERHRAFNRQRLAVRTAIVAAGPVFNFLFAILVYWAIFVVGEPGSRPIIGTVEPSSPAAEAGLQPGDEITGVAGQMTPTWESAAFALLVETLADRSFALELADPEGRPYGREIHLRPDAAATGSALPGLGIRPQRPVVPPVLGKLVSGGAAAAAGLAPGDRVIAADGVSITDWSAWVTYVRARPDQWIALEVERGDRRLDLRLRPERIELEGAEVGQIGAYVELPEGLLDGYRAELRYGPLSAIGPAIGKTWDMSVLMLRMLGRMLVGEASVKNLSGPISIAQYAGKSASVGFGSFVKFLAVVSISLGVLNLLPIPLLDGGHLFYYLIEVVKGSPVSEQIEMVGQRVGLVILLGLMGLAFYLDLERILSG